MLKQVKQNSFNLQKHKLRAEERADLLGSDDRALLNPAPPFPTHTIAREESRKQVPPKESGDPT